MSRPGVTLEVLLSRCDASFYSAFSPVTPAALISNPQRRARLATAARCRARRFTLDRMAQAYSALYQDVMRNSARLETA